MLRRNEKESLERRKKKNERRKEKIDLKEEIIIEEAIRNEKRDDEKN